jgi:FkbM family methyltransferase
LILRAHFSGRRRLVLNPRNRRRRRAGISGLGRVGFPGGMEFIGELVFRFLKFLNGRAHAARQFRQFLGAEQNENNQQKDDQIRSAEISEESDQAHEAKHLPISISCKGFHGGGWACYVRGMGRFAQEFRSLFDKQYRRAFRNLRHLPRMDYRFVIDAGANRGAFTDALLRLHQPERIVLVEAIPDLAMKLQARYESDPRISVVSAALSDRNGEAKFEINRSEASSSLLPIDSRNSAWFGRDLRVASSISVLTLTLPELMTREKFDSVDLLKLDLQGAERLVLAGGAEVLDRVRVIYTEVFFEQLYAGAWLFWDMNEFLSGRGFKLCGLSNIVHAADGDLVQANATFRI